MFDTFMTCRRLWMVAMLAVALPLLATPAQAQQIVVLVNPLIYINDGMRAAFTDAAHMHLYIIYPAIVAFSVIFLTLGLRNFRRKVLA